MQTIPLVYSVIKDLKLHAGPATCTAGMLEIGDGTKVTAIPRLKTGAERGKVIVVDIEGMNKGRFNAPFIEFCKVPGNELWLVEPIYDENDVLDAFIGYADKLIFPYHLIKDDDILANILEISDNCIPLLICRNGYCERKDPVELAERLSDTGFHNIMVIDTDGCITDEAWRALLDACGGLISYSPVREIGIDMHIAAEDVFPISFRRN